MSCYAVELAVCVNCCCLWFSDFSCCIFLCSSHLHCDWRTADELLLGDKRILSKIKRYKLKRAQNPYLAEVMISYTSDSW